MQEQVLEGGLVPTQEPESEPRERHREPPREPQSEGLPTVPSVIIKGEREVDLCTAPTVVLVKEEEKEARVDMIRGGEEMRVANPEIFGVPEGETIEEHMAKVRVVGLVQKSALILPMVVVQSDGKEVTLRALVDTGCEVNLVRKGLIPPQCFQPMAVRCHLVTANGSPLGGGDREITLGLRARGEGVEKRDPLIMEFPTKLMEAEVSVDIILSFNWLVEFNVDLQGRRYGLRTNTTPHISYQGWET